MLNREYIWKVVGGVIIVAVIIYFAIKDAPQPISYECENGDRFILEVVNRSKVKITPASQDPIILSEETELTDPVTVYGDEKNTLTFTSGYGKQVIKTQKGEESLSTICNPI